MRITPQSALPVLRALALVVLAALATAATPVAIAAAQPADPPAPADDPPDLRARLMEHRLAEAASKIRLAKALAADGADKTANQNLWDVKYYELVLDLNPTTHILSGTVTVLAEVTGTSIATLDLNLRSLHTVSACTAGGGATTWSHALQVVTVNLDRTYATGELVEVSVTYSGNPASSYFGWDSHSGQTMIWTLSEPYGAPYWWPCKDLNTDKADSLDLHVTVPDHLIVASNGALVSDVDNGATRTFHWRHRYPINTYLVSLAIYPYTVFNDWYTPLGGGDPMELTYYVYPDHYSSVQATYALTDDMIGVFAAGWGEYPFVTEKYGHAEFTWGGGMEHQTLTSLGGWGEDLISHELAHQWFGDMITCATFHHIWLNEGFATWGEAYWKEQTEGFATYQDYMDAAAFFGPGTIYVEDPSNFYDIFDGNLSYNKGSWVVHMLRGVVGDEDFFDGLALYRATYGYGSATTEQLRDVMETVSGRDLDAFFDQWIHGEYYPVYRYGWSQTGATLDLTIEQVQTNTGLFTMPIRLRVVTDTGTYDMTVENSLASESYALPVSGTVESVQLDPDRWILRQVESAVVNPTFREGILLVNGVDWSTYDTEIRAAYADSVCTGTLAFSFWDCFAAPAGGYPAELPAPLGNGTVGGDLLGQYSTVVWVGNDYNGDLARWQEAPIESYLTTGGNVLLLARRGGNFLDPDFTGYLGVTWAETDATLGNWLAVYPGLVDIPFTGAQNYNDVFYTAVGPNSTLLARDTTGFATVRGTGVHARPPGGGTFREEGGNLAFLSGRPYRMDHAALRANTDFILRSFMDEPWAPSAVPDAREVARARTELLPAYPNPFNPQTVIPYRLPAAARVELAIYDAAGRLVRTLVAAGMPAGTHEARWDGTDDRGRGVASGTYFARLSSGQVRRVTTLVLVR